MQNQNQKRIGTLHDANTAQGRLNKQQQVIYLFVIIPVEVRPDAVYS